MFIIKSLGQIKPIMAEIVLGCLFSKEILTVCLAQKMVLTMTKNVYKMFGKVKIWVVTLRY